MVLKRVSLFSKLLSYFFSKPICWRTNSVEVFFPDLLAGGGGMFRQLEFKNGYMIEEYSFKLQHLQTT